MGDSASGCTSRHRALALGRLGHEVVHLDFRRQFKWNYWNNIFHYRTGYSLLNREVENYVLTGATRAGDRFDVIWCDNGEFISGRLISRLREVYGARIVNYNCDDITGGRDGARWRTLKAALPYYDLCAVVRPPNVREYPLWGARRVMRVWMSADEVVHAPRPLTDNIAARWSSEVLFIGTWMPERGPFMAALLDAGVPLTLWGQRWHKAKEWSRLKAVWRGQAVEGDDYAYAIQCAKVNLGLLSKGNRDLHTTRSLEIPSLGGLLCAERTTEHEYLYTAGKEAVFWSDATECARQVAELLANAPKRRAIARAGRERFLRNGLVNERVVASILENLIKF